MKILKRWHPRTITVGDVSIALKLKALTKAEAVDFLRDLARVGREARDVDPTDEDAVVAGLRRLQGEFVRQSFRDYVRLDEEVGREDGTRIETAEELLDELPTGLTFEVLLAIQTLCVATESQSKAFGSPSGSSSEGGPDHSDSLVTSTSNADGTAPSIAPVTPPGNGASSPLA